MQGWKLYWWLTPRLPSSSYLKTTHHHCIFIFRKSVAGTLRTHLSLSFPARTTDFPSSGVLHGRRNTSVAGVISKIILREVIASKRGEIKRKFKWKLFKNDHSITWHIHSLIGVINYGCQVLFGKRITYQSIHC